MTKGARLLANPILGIVASAVFVGAVVHAVGQTDPLIAAVKAGDANRVRALLVQHANVNAREADGSTALLFAVHQTDTPIAELLVRAGADVNASNRYGITPLLESTRVGATAITRVLLERMANPNVVTPDGTTPLMLAAASGDVEAVRLLVARGVDVNAREYLEDQTALMWAADAGHAAVIETLIGDGADPNASARIWKLPRGRSRVGQPAPTGPEFSNGGLTPLMFAARRGRVDAVHKLAQGGADVRLKAPDGYTAMLLAVVNDHLDAAQALLEHGAGPNDGSFYEAVSLHNLHTNDTIGEATRPRPLHQIDNRTTPIEFMTHLLDRGADARLTATHVLHFQGQQGNAVTVVANQSAFERAVQTQDVEVMQLMLARGVNPSAALGASTPLMLALAGGGGGRGAGIGFQAAAFRYRSDRSARGAVATLLDAGADLDGTNPAGDTALHQAARTGDTAMIEFLAEWGATLDVKDKAGLTPLDFAMGKAPAAPAGGRGPGAGGGGGGRGGPPAGPQPRAIALLREWMGMPPLSDAEMPKPAPGRGGPPPAGEQQ